MRECRKQCAQRVKGNTGSAHAIASNLNGHTNIDPRKRVSVKPADGEVVSEYYLA